VFIPVMSWDTIDHDEGIVLDDAARAVPTKVITAYPGIRQGKWGATFPYYPNECARFWPRLTGTEQTVATSSNQGWQHTFTMNSSQNTPSDTVVMFTGSTETEVRFTGSVYTGLDFKFSRATGMATAKVSAISFGPSTTITAEQATTFPGATTGTGFNAALRGWQAVFAVGGSTKPTLLDFELNVTRAQELVFAANNSRNPVDFQSGELDAKGKMKLYGSTELPWDIYRTATPTSLDLVLTDTLPGSTMNKLEIQMSKVIFTKVTPNLSGAYLTYDVDYQCLHSSSAGTDSGPFSVFTTISSSGLTSGGA
jgi:hypothetical protein